MMNGAVNDAIITLINKLKINIQTAWANLTEQTVAVHGDLVTRLGCKKINGCKKIIHLNLTNTWIINCKIIWS